MLINYMQSLFIRDTQLIKVTTIALLNHEQMIIGISTMMNLLSSLTTSNQLCLLLRRLISSFIRK